jgi:hypothetical protein
VSFFLNEYPFPQLQKKINLRKYTEAKASITVSSLSRHEVPSLPVIKIIIILSTAVAEFTLQVLPPQKWTPQPLTRWTEQTRVNKTVTKGIRFSDNKFIEEMQICSQYV